MLGFVQLSIGNGLDLIRWLCRGSRPFFSRGEAANGAGSDWLSIAGSTLRIWRSRCGNGISMPASVRALATPTVTSLFSRNQMS